MYLNIVNKIVSKIPTIIVTNEILINKTLLYFLKYLYSLQLIIIDRKITIGKNINVR